MRPILKIALNFAGCALAIVGIVFVALRLRNYSTEIDFSRFGVATWSAITTLAIAYGLANFLLALAWRYLLRHFGAGTSFNWAVRTYGISQIAKYVPGNIFHLAGRQAMGMAAGVPAWPLMKSAGWELGLISATGALYGLLTLPLIQPHLPVIASAAVFMTALAIAAFLIRRFIGKSVARAFGLHVIFLFISGLIFVGLFKILAEKPRVEWLLMMPLIGAYVLAWLCGLVTPGAPAGLGIRELVLLFLLNGVVGEADLLLAVVLGRLLTVAGDLGFFFYASAKDTDAIVY